VSSLYNTGKRLPCHHGSDFHDSWPVGDSGDLCWVNHQLASLYADAQVVHGQFEEFALGRFEEQGVLFQQVEEHVCDFFVQGVFPGARHDDAIIHVVTEFARVLGVEGAENLIEHAGEGCRCGA